MQAAPEEQLGGPPHGVRLICGAALLKLYGRGLGALGDLCKAKSRKRVLKLLIAQVPLEHHGRLLGHVTISLGVAISPLDGPAATLLKRADAALLSAKSAGRNVTITASRLAA